MVQGVYTAPRAALLAAIVALGCAWPSPSRAQEPSVEQQLPAPDPNQPAPPSPVPEVEQHFTREQAEALLAASQGADLFEIVALEEGHVGLRHGASGIVCRFSPDFQNRINVVRPGHANSDVACVSGPWPSTMLAASRTNIPPRAFIASIEQTFRREHANTQPFQPSAQYWPAPTRDVIYLHLVSQTASGERSVVHAAAMTRGR